MAGSNPAEVLVSVVLSSRGVCVGAISRPEDLYRVWCVVMCDFEITATRRPRAIMANEP
jgi:hypothetical protein